MGKEIKILFLEDSPTDVELNLYELKKAGFNVIPKITETKADYISALQEFKPDIILADYNLPSFTGMEALDYIKNNAIQIPFILVSGSLGEELAVDTVKRGATDYILKQNLVRLSTSVKRALSDIEERKKMENAENLLRESELKFRTLYLKAPIGISLAGPDNHFLDVNEAFCRMMGYSRKELQNKSVLDITHPDDRERFNTFYKDVVSGIKSGYSVEKQYIKKDGTIICVNVTMAGVRGPDGGFLYGIGMIEDITERKRTEENTRRLSLMLAAAPGMVIIHEKDGRLLYANQRAPELHGYNQDDFMKLSLQDITAPETKAMIGLNIQEVIRKGESAFEAEHIRKDHSELLLAIQARMVDWEGRKVILSVGTDITDRKRAEEALRALSIRQEAILSAVPDIIMEVDNNKTYTWANQAGREFFGGDVIGKEAKFYFEGDQDTYNVVQPLFIGDENIIYIESWQRRKDGEKRLLAWWCRVLKNPAGKISGALSSARDITERKQSEEALRKSEEKFRSYIENSPYGVFIVNENGKYLEVNKAACIATGYAEKELLNKSIPDLLPPESLQYGINQFQELKEKGASDGEMSFVKKDGKKMFWNLKAVKLSGTRFLGFTIDITERKKAEDALKESEEKFRTIFDNVNDGMFLINLENNKFILCNNACSGMLGYSQEEFLGLNIADIHPAEDLTYIYGEIRKFLQGEAGIRSDIRFKKKDGGIIITDLSPADIIISEIKYLIIIFRDISERKRSEEALKASEVRYRRLFESAKDGILIIDAETGVIADVNPFLINMLGYPLEELLGKAIWEIGPLKDIIANRGKFLELQRKEYARYEDLPLETADGRRNEVEFVSNVYMVNGRKVIQCNIRDITERRRSEEELKFRNIILSTQQETSIDGILIVDAEGRIISYNHRFIYMWEIPAEVMKSGSDELAIQSVIGKLVNPEKFLEKLDYLYTHRGETSRDEVALKDGKTFDRYSAPMKGPDGKYYGRVWYFRDITERKRSEEKLRASEVRYRRLFESAKDGILIIDAETGVINDVNPYLIEILGLSYEYFYGKKLWELGFFKDIISNKINFLELLQKEFIRYEDLPMETADGRKIEVEFVSNVYLVDDRKVIQCNIRDITERRRIEEELLRHRDHLEEMVSDRTVELVKSEENLKHTRDQAEAANKAKTVFLSSMSHEIRTPLNAVLGFSQLMLRDASLTVQQIEWLNTINRSGEHLLALINDILEISRIESGRVSLSPDLFDLKSFHSDLEKMFRARVEEKNLKLQMVIDSKVPRFIELDGNKLRQIFINLIGNAVKFTDEGTITVRMSAERKEKDQYRLIAEVEDTGPGITPEDLNKIFNKFEQTAISLRKGGTGLGLSISRQFARMMGGDITVKSEAGKGSCFRLELDFKERNAPELEIKADRRIITGLKKGLGTFRILIADDEPANRMLLKDLLNKTGFEVVEASDGREAVKKYKERPPALVFLDMRMPVMDGYTAIKKMKSLQKGAHVPIIAVTASAFDVNRKKMMDAGIDGYIRKPYKIQEIYDILKLKLGVQYTYAKAPSGRADKAGKITKEALRGLPENLAGRMLEAAVRVDLDRLLELIDEAAKTSPALSVKLRVMAKSFRYDELIKLLKNRGKI